MKKPETNRERLDSANLRTKDVPKDEIAKRRQSQHDVRRAAREARRAEKSEPKQARKANVKRVATWTGEHKVLDKLKKATNKAAKAEKRRKQLEIPESLMKAQAEELKVRAAKAAGRAVAHAEYKDKEDAITELSRKQTERKGDNGSASASGSDSDSHSDSSSSQIDKDEESRGEAPKPVRKKSENSKKTKSKAVKEDTLVNEQVEAITDGRPKGNTPDVEKPLKKTLKKSKKSKTKTDEVEATIEDEQTGPKDDKAETKNKKRKRASEALEAPANEGVEKTSKKVKKRKRDAEAPSELETEEESTTNKTKKDNTRKRDFKSATVPTNEEGVELVADSEEAQATTKKPKKHKKRKKHKRDSESAAAPVEEEVEILVAATENVVTITDGNVEKSSKKSKKGKEQKRDLDTAANPVAEEEPASKKYKKDKKLKKAKDVGKHQDSLSAAENKAAVTTAEAEQWNVQELEGGESRQAKFLRLLGGKKGGAPAATKGSASSSRPHLDINKASKELEQQFEAGRRMKFDAGGQRKGLGA